MKWNTWNRRGVVGRKALLGCVAGVGLAVGGVALLGDRAMARPQDQGNPFDGEALIAGLLETPGCLGADAGQFMSGKNAIFAWFENKAAAMAWYKSATHQRAMQVVFPEFEDAGAPMEGVPDDVPIMAIATITPGGMPNGAIGGAPLSQISIELYTPLKGGIHIGGTFAPEGLKVPGLRDVGVR